MSSGDLMRSDCEQFITEKKDQPIFVYMAINWLHYPMQGTQKYRGCKGNLFEGGLRISSVVSWPGKIPEGESRDQMAFGCDWLPTIADYVGCELPSTQLDGKSIRPVIRSGDAPTPHEHLYWYLGRGDNAQWAVRSGDWKLLGDPKDPRQPKSRDRDDKLFPANLKDDIS